MSTPGKTQKPFYRLSIDQTLKILKTSQHGLDSKEAEQRIKKYGPNKLPEGRQISGAVIFFNQFKNFLIIILIIAFAISIIAGETSNAIIIILAVTVNVIFGFIQEFKAHKAFSALKKIITYHVKVIRDNKIKTIDAAGAVRGDIVILDAGDRVPADCRVISANSLQVNEAPLTGESAPVSKNQHIIKNEKLLAERSNMLYTGTTIIDGRAKAVVCAMGGRTELGKIAGSLQNINIEESPLQKKLKGFARFLGLIILAVAAFIFITGIWAGQDVKEMFLISIAVAVAALPEGLVIAVTVVLAVGMQRILRQKALVRKLLAAETLGSTTIICTDKTGTLTMGQMMLDKIVTFGAEISSSGSQVKEKSQDLIKALEVAVLCNNAYIEGGDNELQKEVIKGSPTERALLAAAVQAGLDIRQLQHKYRRIDEIPFNSERKFMATTHATHAVENDGKHQIMFIKGAPEKLLPFATTAYHEGRIIKLSENDKKKLEQQIEKLSGQGFRLLLGGFAETSPAAHEMPLQKNIPANFTFVCFYGLRDPIRPDVKKMLELTKSAGIKTLMITGDHKLTAGAVAREIGLIETGQKILDSQEMAKMSDEELASTEIKVFARVSPQDKLRLVRVLKEQGEIVAMTGDGINDAPALMRADIGVALGSGTDVAKGAADIILLKDDFSILVKAIEEGRVIFDNIRKVVLYLLSDSFSEVILISLSLIFKLPLPLTVAQILWINIITESLPAFAMTMEPKEKKIMQEPPRNSQAPILNGEMKFLAVLITGVTGSMVFAVFLFFKSRADLETARTAAFAALSVTSLLYVFSVRSLKHSLFSRRFFSNHWLIAGVIGGLLIQLTALYLPPLAGFLRLAHLGAFEWGIILIECLVVILLIETVKWGYARKVKK
ncbi:MAG: HAD-IC family P-type ATPase [Candidatus Jacksonbacteria bacterium]